MDGEGHISNALPWEQGNGTKESSYSCTFADSDGVLSDSDESHSGEEGDNHSNDILSFKDGRTKSVEKVKCKAGHKSNHLKIEDDDERTREDQSSGSDDGDKGLVEGEKEGKKKKNTRRSLSPLTLPNPLPMMAVWRSFQMTPIKGTARGTAIKGTARGVEDHSIQPTGCSIYLPCSR